MIRPISQIKLSLLFAFLFTAPSPLLAEEPAADSGVTKAAAKKPEATKFLRLLRDEDKQPTEMQTAIARYVPDKTDAKLVVDLVGVVHIADKNYYQTLNKKFEDYDVVLYELVAPKGKAKAIPRKTGRNDNPISMLQEMSKSMLKLESQAEHIDYTAKNFVHADMSPEEMSAAMRKRGEDGFTLMLGVMADMMRQANKQAMQQGKNGQAQMTEVDLIKLLLDPNAGGTLKVMMAEQFAQLESLDGGLGPTLGRLLIDDRNGAAMKVFGRELAKGHKRIAIFYGAAHMPDFEKRLKADYGLKRKEVQWLTAWDLTKEGTQQSPPPLQQIFRLFAPPPSKPSAR